MIEWVKLTDFQKYRKKFIRFDPRVTTIVGHTDRGKSTVLRALALLCLNLTPRTRKGGRDPYIRHGRNQCVVTAKIDGHKITRKKGKKNVYILDGKEFKAVGNSPVPEEIAKTINVGEDNFQLQLDLPFWFTDTPGNVSRKLNRIVNLEVIDQTLKNVATELRDTKAELSVTMKRLKTAKGERKKLDWVVQFHKDVKRLERLKHNLDAVSRESSEIEGLLLNVQRVRQRHDLASKTILEAHKAIAVGRKLLKREQEIKGLEKLLGRIKKAKTRLRTPIPDITDLIAFRKEADDFCEWLSEFESFVEKIQGQKEKVCGSRARLTQSQKRLKKKLKGRCPVCGQKTGRKSSVSHAEICTSATKRP